MPLGVGHDTHCGGAQILGRWKIRQMRMQYRYMLAMRVEKGKKK
jgi:hypothetical protein